MRTTYSRLTGAEWLSIISMADEIGEVLSLEGLSNGRTIVNRMDSGHLVIITQRNTPGQEPFIRQIYRESVKMRESKLSKKTS